MTVHPGTPSVVPWTPSSPHRMEPPWIPGRFTMMDGSAWLVAVLRCCTSPGEQIASPRDELLDGLRGSAGDFLDRGGHAVIPILAMEPGHGRDVLIDIRSEVGACEHLLGPRIPRNVDVRNRSAQGAGVLFGDAVHVLRSGTRQL